MSKVTLKPGLFSKKMIVLIFAIFVSSIALNAQSVYFNLKNNSAVSIPLKIPGVMNPNLSPMSNSAVDLKIGQKIFFKHKKKNYLLLEVTSDKKDQTLIVNQLIEKRKKELGLK